MDEVLETLRLFPKQCQQAWEETQQLNFSKIGDFTNITVCSMGASSFGYYVVKSLFEFELKVPLLLISDYHLPQYVDSDSLVFLSSYSGTTEETISCCGEAKNRTKNIVAITQPNSELGKLLNNYTYYQLHPTYNPSGQPRMAVGYTVFGMMGIFYKLGLLKTIPSYNFEGETEQAARNFAEKLQNRQVILIAGEHLQGCIHVFRNQLNESSKNIASYNLLPELNHHLLEGLSRPREVKKDTKVIIFNSSLYSGKIKKRAFLTKEVMEKNGLEVEVVEAEGKNIEEQVFWTLSLGSFTSYFLSQINKEDPKSIPWVDYFKKRLAE